MVSISCLISYFLSFRLYLFYLYLLSAFLSTICVSSTFSFVFFSKLKSIIYVCFIYSAHKRITASLWPQNNKISYIHSFAKTFPTLNNKKIRSGNLISIVGYKPRRPTALHGTQTMGMIKIAGLKICTLSDRKGQREPGPERGHWQK